MKKYRSNQKNIKAFTLALSGVSINATASRMGMSAGRVRHALHNECRTRCPATYGNLIQGGSPPTLTDLRSFKQTFLADTEVTKPEKQLTAQVSQKPLSESKQPFLLRILTSIFK
jgi:hypothetical protein